MEGNSVLFDRYLKEQIKTSLQKNKTKKQPSLRKIIIPKQSIDNSVIVTSITKIRETAGSNEKQRETNEV